MIYKCLKRNCQFLFERRGIPEQCPDCGYDGIREATPEEIEEYRTNRLSGERERRKK